MYACAVVLGNAVVLQSPGSDVRLFTPKGIHGLITSYVHTTPTLFLNELSPNECLISPIVECHFTCFQEMSMERYFEIRIPHCLTQKKYLKDIIVWHGDINKNIPFSELPSKDNECFFKIHEKYISVFTPHFSQFFCTICDTVCQSEAKAFVFGSLSPPQHTPISAAVRLYVASPLYKIQDFKNVNHFNSNSHKGFKLTEV